MKCSAGMNIRRLAVVMALSALAIPAGAATTGIEPDATVDAGGQSRPQSRFVREFAGFAGSEENARSLYGGLRSGTNITLAAPAGGGAGTTALQFDPPTRPMGNGSVFIGTALAREQLARYGITDPTPQQLQAALTGGSIMPAGSGAQPVELRGVLAQRAGGMGWGAIARSQGSNLGRVVSGLRGGAASTTPSLATAAPGTAGPAVSATAAAGDRVTTAGGRALNAGSGHGTGIVNASGQALGAGINPHAGVRAGGAATGLGAAGAPRAGAGAQGQGKGLSRH